MVEETSPSKRGKGILILVLFLVMAGSAVAGFVLFKDKVFGARGGPSAGSSTSSPTRTAATEPKPPDKRDDPKSMPPPGAAQAGVKPGTPGPSQSPETASPSPGPVAPGAVDSSKAQQAGQTAQVAQVAGAKVTLQAASFPSEASAKQFQDRLVQAGLPAYVVSADIPHRGKWYRVRAGKFASQDEARQAAESWRKRMAAAGINSQLVPCEYQ